MCKDRFLFFENYNSIAEKLPDDLRLKFYDALMGYVFKDIEPDDVVISALITAIKPSLDKEDTRGGYRDGAGRKPNKTQSNEIKNNQKESKLIKINQIESNNNQNNQSFLETGNKKQETGSIKEKDNLKVITKEKFTKPTIEELKSYFAEKGYEDESERFYDFYSSKGWMVGKNPMKDWRAAVRNWVRGKEPQQILKPKQTIEEKNRESLVEFLRLSGEIQ
jgi:hypothetical protein